MVLQNDGNLEQAYEKVFERSKLAHGFDPKLLVGSQALFSFDDSLKVFIPKFLDVNALLSGIEFSRGLQIFSQEIQKRIDEIIRTNCRYWVAPENLGVEYLVTKWPDAPPLPFEHERNFLGYISSLQAPKFIFRIRGFQVNPDGCVVLRGYEDGYILGIRDCLRNAFNWIPSRQSGWAHIPLGRILCHLDEPRYRNLIDECQKSFNSDFYDEMISEIHYVHEKQWYMVTKAKLQTISLI